MQKLTFKNGITVLFERRPMESVAVEVQIKVGSANESKKQEGMTHLIEHMLFEGTTTRTGHEISNAIESVGGEFNAVTIYERTFYYIHIPRQYFKRALGMMADIIKNPLFDEKILKKEKNVVLNEIKVTNDDPKSYLWILFMKTLFKKHKARNPIYGNAEAILKMSRDDMIRYHKTHYIPSNITISIVGNIPSPFKIIKKYFENIPSRSPSKEPPTKEPPLKQPQKKTIKRDVEHVYLALGYPAAPKGHPDSYALEVIRSILGRGQSSRLFDEIRTKRGIAYMVGAMYESSRTFGAFASYISTNKEHLHEARKVLLDAFKLKNLTKKEVKDAKNYLIGNFILYREDAKGRADNNAEWSLFNKEPVHYPQRIKKITLEDVQRVARKYFHKNYTEVLIHK